MSSDCDCCTGIGTETPVTVTNRAGLPAVSYRIGTYGQFLSSMLAAIGTTTAHGLRTRNSDDFSIAFLDACAIAADVLTFYDERNANENYLRTATELLSIGELARLIGYSLRPGCSAAAYLAFRLNDPPVNPDPTSPGATSAALSTLSSALGVTIPAGTKVQSVPGPGEMPQLFETSADLDARWVDNALDPLSARPYPSGSSGIGAIYLPGSGSGRNVGDKVMLIDDSGAVQLRTVVGHRRRCGDQRGHRQLWTAAAARRPWRRSSRPSFRRRPAISATCWSERSSTGRSGIATISPLSSRGATGRWKPSRRPSMPRARPRRFVPV